MIGKLARAALLTVLATACGGAADPTPAPPTEVEVPPTAFEIPTQVPSAPVSAFAAPDEAASFPLDLVVLEAANLQQLAPVRRLSADGLPAQLAEAALAYPVSYQFQLAALLGDGQLVLWNMVTGQVGYRDLEAAAPLQAGGHPALAISTAFQSYLATPTTVSGVGQAQAVLVRPPDDTGEPLVLSGASEAFTPEAVTGLAFSPDGHLLAAGLVGGGSGLLKVWDIWDARQVQLKLELPSEQPVSAVQFTPSGAGLIVAAGDTLVQLDLETGGELSRRSFDFPVRGLSVGRSGGSLTVWGEQTAIVETPTHLDPLVIPATGEFRRVSISADERLAVLADGPRLRLWDLVAGQEVASFSDGAEFLDAAFFDNGRLLATIDSRARALVWGVRGGLELPQEAAQIRPGNVGSLIRAASMHVPGVRRAQVSLDGNQLTIGSSYAIYLLELPGLEIGQAIDDANLGFSPITWTADGRYAAWVTPDNTALLWDREQGEITGEIQVPDEFCCSQLILPPDGRYLVTLGGGVARVWQPASGEEIMRREGVQKVHALQFGSLLAFQQGLEVNLVGVQSGVVTQTLGGFETAAPVVNTEFSPDEQVMMWTSRATMQFSEVESGALGPAVPFSWGEFSPRGDRIAAVEDGWIMQTVGQLHEIDMHTGDTVQVFDHQEEAIIDAAAYSPDGSLLATATELSVRIWNGQSGAQLAVLPDTSDGIFDLAFSPDGRWLVTVSNDDLVEIWAASGETEATGEAISAANARQVQLLDAVDLGQTATEAVFSPDGNTVAIATGSGQIWYWDLATSQTAQAVSRHAEWVYRLAYDQVSGSLLSVSKDGQVRAQGGAAGSGLGATGHVGEVSALAILPDGSAAVTSGQDGTLRFWQLPELQLLSTATAHPDWVWVVAVAPAGNRLASAAADGSIQVWQLREDSSGDPSINLTSNLSGHTAAVWGLDFSPDGRRLASGAWDRTVRVWDTASGAQRMVLEGHTDWVYDVAYSLDGTLLASASADGTVRLWSATTGQPLATLFGPIQPIRSVRFSPDGSLLVSASESGAVQLWEVTR